MRRVHHRGEAIREYILSNVEDHPRDVASVVADHFAITRQAVHKHVSRLVREGTLIEEGKTRGKIYKLAPTSEFEQIYKISPTLQEDQVFLQAVLPRLGPLAENVLTLWQYGFTEMFNNAIDHSQGESILVTVKKYPTSSEVWIVDDGVGIFRKIQLALGLNDERQSVLELSKGKFTTDPRRHSGEGIFFSSRSFDSFVILSGSTYFTHEAGEAEDWILETEARTGTSVLMKLSNHTSRILKHVFDEFSTDDDFGFTKTVVPVKLARYGTENLLSRSQAKRLLARVDKFQTVLFDFREVDTIGQAFADEIFRVFALEHPQMRLLPVNANEEVTRMIDRVRHTNAVPTPPPTQDGSSD